MTEHLRQTESGIYLVDPAAEKGKPFVQLLHDYPGAVTNVVGPDDDDVERVARQIAELQAAIERGEAVEPWEFVEPIFGRTNYLSRAGIASVRHVCRAFTEALDVIAEQQHIQRKAAEKLREHDRAFVEQGDKPHIARPVHIPFIKD